MRMWAPLLINPVWLVLALRRDADCKLCPTSVGEVCNVQDAGRAGGLLGALHNVVKSGGTCRCASTSGRAASFHCW